MPAEWQTGRPPHNQLVEVEDESGAWLRVRAIWGSEREGRLPHWESEDRDILWEPRAFRKWRVLEE